MRKISKFLWPGLIAATLALAGLVTLPGGVDAQATYQSVLARVVAYGSSPTALTVGGTSFPIADKEGRPYVNDSHPFPFSCVLTATATTSTQITGCEVVTGKSYWITDVVIAREAANAVSTPTILQSGTSTACTGPAILLSTYGGALSTTPISLRTPIKATASHGLCLLDGTTGTKKITVTGFIAP